MKNVVAKVFELIMQSFRLQAALDKMRSGGCPICHRYFMIFYILREKGLIDLIVTTFLPENPPKEILEFSNGKHYPLVKVTF